MPVPVPRHSKPPSHPVVKPLGCGNCQPNSFQTLTHTSALPLTGLPSLGSRDQRIDSLPTWRRTKSRRIWEEDTPNFTPIEQDFNQGLTVAGNAPVIKGEHAEACIPPIGNLFDSSRLPTAMPIDLLSVSDNGVDGSISDYSTIVDGHLENQTQWPAGSSIAIDDGGVTRNNTLIQSLASTAIFPHLALYNHTPERAASTPILLDQSPSTPSGPGRDSSPLQPITPFGSYVDRAVTSEPQMSFGATITSDVPPQNCDYPDEMCGDSRGYIIQPSHQHMINPPQGHLLPSAPHVVSPTASVAYRKLAEPLSDWVANYVWKACTTGLSLSSTFVPSSDRQIATYSVMPPAYLAASVHSLLLSTLLQPSAIFLAIWYIVRLPVYFPATLGPEPTKEVRFRAALLGDSFSGPEREAMEASAPFRLIVLGCMLANKWLDDHTFSNKTWHNISNIPIHALNKLESLTLEVFAYDLTVPAHDWSQWLSHLSSYHSSLASPIHTQPISRPSTSPHAIVRKVIDEISIIPAKHESPSVPQPVFVGLEERRQEKLEKERAMITDVSEINLDEDGPLREEYLPKRRVSGAGLQYNPHTHRSSGTTDKGVGIAVDWEQNLPRDHRSLPPPAKWSPAGDEPLYPEKNRVTGRYAAVQPPPLVHPSGSYLAPYHPPVDVHSHYTWSSATYPVKPQPHYEFDLPVLEGLHHQASYSTYTYIPQIPISHSRSQSLSYDQENLHFRNHARMFPQTGSEYQYSHPFPANDYNQGPVTWRGANHYQYTSSALAPIQNIFTYPPSWLRT